MKKIHIVSFHGLYSQGDNLETLVERLRVHGEVLGYDITTSQHDYPKLNATMGYFKWSRDIVRDYILKCLALEYQKHSDRYLIVICHSNATWGISRAIGKYNEDVEFTCDRTDVSKIILFGSTIKRNYNWGRYPEIDVVNFVGTKDKVVWFSKLFKMGWSGRKGFKIAANNLTQIWSAWRHSDFVLPKNFELIKQHVFKGV